jgi:hypothetical protein
MKDDEFQAWRRQWHDQPAMPIDLIRKVERETMRMWMGVISHIVPVIIGIVTIIGAIANPNALSILFACGLWVFMVIGWVYGVKRMKGVWSPAAETTAAYIELSIARCRSRVDQVRFANVLSPLLTTFVLTGLYELFKSAGKLQTTADYVIVGVSFLWTIAVVSFVLMQLARQRKKTVAELTYLLDLKSKLQNGPTN